MSSPASATVSVLLLPSKDTVVPSRLPPMGTETHCTSKTPMLPGKGRWVRAPHLNQSLKSATPEWYCRVWLDHGSASPGLECPEVSSESSQAWRSHALKADSSSAQSRVALGSHCSQFWDRGSTVAAWSAPSPGMPQALSSVLMGAAASHGSASVVPVPQSKKPLPMSCTQRELMPGASQPLSADSRDCSCL